MLFSIKLLTMIVHIDMGRTNEEVILSYFGVLFKHSLTEPDKRREIPQPEYPYPD
jgi:hypothetical protein